MRVEITYEELDDIDHLALLNGCGPQSRAISRWFDVPNLIFVAACDRHDFDYMVGGPRDRSDGDSSWRLEAEARQWHRYARAIFQILEGA